MQPCANSIFHASPARRVALARERFFEEGVRPTGLTSESVIQSWARCLQRHRDAREAIEFDPVSDSRAHLAQQRNRDLVTAWGAELPLLQSVLRGTPCSAVLTDASGVVIAAAPFERPHERLMPIAHRTGVNLSEEAIGTTAPGIVVKTGNPVTVLGGEHFFDAVQSMHCAAAPIHNTAGRLAGVLDISSEGLPFGFDASALVATYAGALENRLLTAQSTGLLVLRLQIHPTLLGTPNAALVAIDAGGKVVWANRSAAALLGIEMNRADADAIDAQATFDLRLGQLASLSRADPCLVALPNGLSVWVRAESAPWRGEARQNHASNDPATGQARSSLANAHGFAPRDARPEARIEKPTGGVTTSVAPSVPPSVAPSVTPSVRSEAHEGIALRSRDRALIASVLTDCGGNVSKAAKQLQVSRGLIYRRLKDDNDHHADIA